MHALVISATTRRPSRPSLGTQRNPVRHNPVQRNSGHRNPDYRPSNSDSLDWKYWRFGRGKRGRIFAKPLEDAQL
jgi:hypothetical protein